MSTLTVDNPHFEYVTGVHPHPGRCHVRIFDQGAGDVVLIVSDPGDENTGMSVSAAVGIIVTAVARRYELDPIRLTVVEHHDGRWTRVASVESEPHLGSDPVHTAGREEGERFDVVRFAHVPAKRIATAVIAENDLSLAEGADPLDGDEFAGPEWRQITKRQAEALLGQALP